MEKYYSILNKVPLFNGLCNDLSGMLKCLNANVKSYKKDNIIFFNGDEINSIGIILSGKVKIIKEDFNGNENIILEHKIYDTFGEAYCFSGINKINVTVIASSNCEIMFIDYKKSIHLCSNICDYHQKLIENILKIISLKNISLNDKINIITKNTIREKILTYLKSQRELSKINENSKSFTIPFNRLELSEFLSVNRSALSRELSKMKSEGLIDFHKNEFRLL